MDLGSVLAMVKNASFLCLLAAICFAVGGRFFASFRWYLLLRGSNPDVTYNRVTRLVFVSSLLGMFMPGQFGVEVLRVYGMSRTTTDVALSVSSVVVERILAMLILVLLVIFGLTFSPTVLPPQLMLAAWVALVIVITSLFCIMHDQPRRVVDYLISAAWLEPVRYRVNRLYRAFDWYKKQPDLIAASLLASVGATAFRIIPTILVAQALKFEIPLVYFAVFVPVIAFVVQLPISIGGLGVRETSFIYLFGLVGVTAEESFTLAFVVYALTIFSATPGAWFYAREGVGYKKQDHIKVDTFSGHGP